MRKNVFVLTLSLLITIPFFAQKANIFHNRNFWKENPSIKTIDKYISEGHDITTLNQYAFDAVSWAFIEKTDNETIKYLLTYKGNDVNKLTHDGRTYIFWAAYKNNLEMMKYLVERGAKTDIVDSHGYSLLNFAATTGQSDTSLYDYIFDNGANIISEKNHSGANALLLVAPFLSSFELVDYFISKGANLKTTDDNGNGIFNYAAKGGNIEFLQKLIDKGIDFKTLNSKGGNAVMMASQGTRGRSNGIEVYKFLEGKGLNINVVGAEGKNPLHNLAYRNEDLELMNYLLSKGVDINKKDKEGYTPFMNASNSNSLTVVKVLYHKVKDINATDNEGRSALTRALDRNKIEIVNFLIDSGADVSIKDNNGNSLMYYLMNTYSSNTPDIFETKLKILESAGVQINETQGDGKTLLHIAAEKNNLALLKRVSEFSLDINKKSDDGLTALHIAAMKAHNSDILTTLLDLGADKNVKTDFEESVFDLASENESLQGQNIDISFLNE